MQHKIKTQQKQEQYRRQQTTEIISYANIKMKHLMHIKINNSNNKILLHEFIARVV